MATLYVGGRVFDGEKVLDGQAVLEEDGKVKRVAPAAEFTGFSGDKVDTAGGTLIPGIIDCHVHSLSGAEGNPGAVQDRMTAAQISPPAPRGEVVAGHAYCLPVVRELALPVVDAAGNRTW